MRAARRKVAQRTLHSRRAKESGWKAQSKYSAGDRRSAKRDPQRGDPGIRGNPPESLLLLSSGGEVLRRLEEAKIGPAEGGRETCRRCLIL